jgi:hypothetical protein
MYIAFPTTCLYFAILSLLAPTLPPLDNWNVWSSLTIWLISIKSQTHANPNLDQQFTRCGRQTSWQLEYAICLIGTHVIGVIVKFHMLQCSNLQLKIIWLLLLASQIMCFSTGMKIWYILLFHQPCWYPSYSFTVW